MHVSEQQSPGREGLHLYLNDHLAGSVAAIEMVDNLIEHHPEDRFGKFFHDLRNEIHADQEKLRDLIQKVGAEESTIRKAGAWFAIVSLIFWCSCERHHVGELEGRTEGDPPHQHETKSDQPASTTNASHTAPTPAPRNSPANFFPDKPKP